MQNRDQHISLIKKYLTNQMLDKERYAFERKMEADPFLKDAVEGFETLQTEEISTSLDQLHQQINKKKHQRIIPGWLRIAAIFMLVIGLSTLLYVGNNNQPHTLTQNNISENAPKPEGIETTTERLSEQKNRVAKEKTKENIPYNKPTKTNSITNYNQNKASEIKNTYPHTKKTKKISTINNHAYIEDVESMQVDDENLIMDDIDLSIKGKVEGVKIKNFQNNNADNDFITNGLALVKEDSFIQYRGRIIDEEGFPLPGVTISDASTNNGTVSDINGDFVIESRKSDAILSFNSIGFKPKTHSSKIDSIGEITLENEAYAFNELVVVGYGTQKKLRKQVSSQKPTLKEQLLTAAPINNKLAEPKMGIKKFIRKIERNIDYPHPNKNTNPVEVKVNIFISPDGFVNKVEFITPIDIQFLQKIETKIKTLGTWDTPKINGNSIASTREVIFKFD